MTICGHIWLFQNVFYICISCPTGHVLFLQMASMKLQIQDKVAQMPHNMSYLGVGCSYDTVPAWVDFSAEQDLKDVFSDPIKYGALAQITDQLAKLAQTISKSQLQFKKEFTGTVAAIMIPLLAVGIGKGLPIEVGAQLFFLAVVAAAAVYTLLFVFELKVISAYSVSISSHLRFASCSVDGNVPLGKSSKNNSY